MYDYWFGADQSTRNGTARDVVILDEAVNALPFSRVECPDLRAIGEVWLSLPRDPGALLPRWSSFAPSMIPQFLNKVCILRVGDWRRDEIEFSLYGGHATERVGNGHPLKMARLRDDPERCQNYHDIRDRAGRAVEFEAPQFARKTLSWDGCDDVAYELLMLPFLPEDGVSRVMQPITAGERPRADHGL